MPNVIIAIGEDWADRVDLPEIDLPVVPRIGESVVISGRRAKVADVVHDLGQDSDGNSIVRIRILVASNEKLFG